MPIGAKVPYQTVKKTLYYTGLILFTIVTLGLGSMIWVLPSPFAQPLPSQVPFGRDLGYKALADKVTILPRGRISGLLYFNTPYEDQVVAKGSIEFQVLEKDHSKNPEGLSIKERIPLNSSGKSDLNPVIEILHGFF